MPEIAEVEKLRLQLNPAWTGRTITRWQAPPESPNPKKYPQHEWSYFREKTSSPIQGMVRLGKALCVDFGGHFLQFHFNSTGWWMPGNEEAARATQVDQIYENFLHKVNERSVRLKMHFDDGQIWLYHDGRTWSKWWIREGASLRENEYFAGYGPDWFTETERAIKVLSLYRSKRLVKDVLCDQKVTAGLGNYMACEIAWLSDVHPHSKWDSLTPTEKALLAQTSHSFALQCMDKNDHEHWSIFGKKTDCPRHQGTGIQYVKDAGNMRGSYFCPICQVKK